MAAASCSKGGSSAAPCTKSPKGVGTAATPCPRGRTAAAPCSKSHMGGRSSGGLALQGQVSCGAVL